MEQSFELDVKAEIKALLELCAKANPYGTKSQKEADEAFWLAVRDLDRKAKCGPHPVMPGRFVRLPAKDSYAYYVVTRVTKKTVKLTHIPYGPKYESGAVQDGEAEIQLIENTLGWYDRIESRLAELGRKPLQDLQAEYGRRDERVEAQITLTMQLRGISRAEAIPIVVANFNP